MVVRIFVKHLYFDQCKILLYVPRVCSCSHEKRILVMSCPPIHPSVRLFGCISGSKLGGFTWNLILGTFTKIRWEIRIWLKSSQNFGRFMKTQVCFIVAGDINDSISALFEMVSGSWDSRGGVNITRTCYSVTSYVHCVHCFISMFCHSYKRVV